MNAPDSWFKTRFSSMVKSKISRASFINTTLVFLEEHNLDGIEIDWEYPGDEERGGNSWDKAGLVSLVSEYKAAAKKAGRTALLSVALPAAPGEWDCMDPTAMAPNVDYFIMMTYDFKGPWLEYTGYHSAWQDPDPKGDDVLATIKHYTRAKIPASQLNLGIGAYGRSWTLKKPLPEKASTSFRSKGSGPGKAGRCDSEKGVLAWRDIKSIMEKYKDAWVFEDPGIAKSAFMLFDDQFVSFDLPQSIYLKQQVAVELGIGGFSLWNSHLDDESWTMTKQLASMQDPGPFSGPGISASTTQVEVVPDDETKTVSHGEIMQPWCLHALLMYYILYALKERKLNAVYFDYLI